MRDLLWNTWGIAEDPAGLWVCTKDEPDEKPRLVIGMRTQSNLTGLPNTYWLLFEDGHRLDAVKALVTDPPEELETRARRLGLLSKE